MDKITIEVEDLTKISDGYHTIEELYEHRSLLFINLALAVQDKYDVYYKIDDNIPNWFILYIELPTGQISYHIPNKYLKYMKNILSKSSNKDVWDKHTSQDVLDRLSSFAKTFNKKGK